ncbi:hypothetical protein B0H10DRAFT_2216267 [Mycena sp. CBHHK59/15]|nr:hypothetical protein B0H10DRAFT_2216267 [Mycena sp. CBHHK59/15]
MRVLIWHAPLSFLSLVQKIGRCVRLATLLGEAILYITGAAYIRYEIELEILRDGAAEDDMPNEQPEQPGQLVDGEQMDRDAAVEALDEAEQPAVLKRKSKKVMSAMEAWDRRFLLEYIVTKGCRRIPWNKFFGNDSKCKILMSDLVVDRLAARVRDITSVDAIQNTVRWHWASKYGDEVVAAIQDLLVHHPDLELQAREEQQREHTFATLTALAKADLHKKLVVVFDAWPLYYEIIKEPISMAQIKKYSHNKQLVRSTTEYAALWHRLFDNARQFNLEGSQIYEDANFLQEVLGRTLDSLAVQHNVPLVIRPQCEFHLDKRI